MCLVLPLSNTCYALLPMLKLLLNYECFKQHLIYIRVVYVDCSEITLKRHRKTRKLFMWNIWLPLKPWQNMGCHGLCLLQVLFCISPWCEFVSVHFHKIRHSLISSQAQMQQCRMQLQKSQEGSKGNKAGENVSLRQKESHHVDREISKRCLNSIPGRAWKPKNVMYRVWIAAPESPLPWLLGVSLE